MVNGVTKMVDQERGAAASWLGIVTFFLIREFPILDSFSSSLHLLFQQYVWKQGRGGGGGHVQVGVATTLVMCKGLTGVCHVTSK